MALEEFLIKRVATLGENPATTRAAVRFYSFPADTIVLGYAQSTDILKKEDPSFLVTRRITGGSHVQTGANTMAYAFVIPRDGRFSNYEEMRVYYADAVGRAFTDLGMDPIDVDNKASTIMINGRIIASHAMFWGVRSALMHGLIILQPYDVDKIAERVALQKRRIGKYFYPEYLALKRLPAVSVELRKKLVKSMLEPKILRQMIADAILKHVSGGRYTEQKITQGVIREAMRLVAAKYNVYPWVKERKPAYTAEEVEEIPGEDLAGPLKTGLGYCLFLQVQDADFKEMSEPE